MFQAAFDVTSLSGATRAQFLPASARNFQSVQVIFPHPLHHLSYVRVHHRCLFARRLPFHSGVCSSSPR